MMLPYFLELFKHASAGVAVLVATRGGFGIHESCQSPSALFEDFVPFQTLIETIDHPRQGE